MVTFGAVGDMARVTPAMAETWARILGAVPASRILFGNVTVMCPASRARAQELFAHFGVLDRIAFQEDVAEDVMNLEFLSQVDVILDPFPVSGATDICEALVMGIPVVTLAGESRRSRTGASILHAAGRADWVAEDAGAYVGIAAGLAMNRDRLADMRADLGAAVAKSGLCDREGFTAALEDAYQRMLAPKPAKKAGKATVKKPAAKKKPVAKKKTAAKKTTPAKPRARRSPARSRRIRGER
jgi:predicted O-linked N-acetylglucosamine transferase (SPINDLY family)